MLVHRCRILSHRPAAVSATQLCHATPTGTSDVAEHGGAQSFQLGPSENSGTGSAAPSEVGVPHVGRIARPTRQLTCFSHKGAPANTAHRQEAKLRPRWTKWKLGAQTSAGLSAPATGSSA